MKGVYAVGAAYTSIVFLFFPGLDAGFRRYDEKRRMECKITPRLERL